jgi:proline dehydrogenase
LRSGLPSAHGSDVDALIAAGAAVRLVKGAYAEPVEIAFGRKSEVDENYFRLAKKLLGQEARWNGVRAALATHDPRLVNRIIVWAAAEGIRRRSSNSKCSMGFSHNAKRSSRGEGIVVGFSFRMETRGFRGICGGWRSGRRICGLC